MPGQYDESKHKRDQGKFARTQGQGAAAKPDKGLQQNRDKAYQAGKARLDQSRAQAGSPEAKAHHDDSQESYDERRGKMESERDVRNKANADPAKLHKHLETGHQAAAGALQAIEKGDMAQASAYGSVLQKSLQGMVQSGAPREQIDEARQNLVNLSVAIKIGDHVMAHEAAVGLKHTMFKAKHESLGNAQKDVDAGSPNQPDPAFKQSLDTLKSAGLVDKAGYDKKLGEHVLSRQDQGSDKTPYKTQGEKQREYEAFIKQQDAGVDRPSDRDPRRAQAAPDKGTTVKNGVRETVTEGDPLNKAQQMPTVGGKAGFHPDDVLPEHRAELDKMGAKYESSSPWAGQNLHTYTTPEGKRVRVDKQRGVHGAEASQRPPNPQ